LQDELDRINSNAFFILNHLAGDTFRIELIKDIEDRNPFAMLSKRKVLISNKLFPIVFDYDTDFASSETGDKILKKARKDVEFSYSRRFSLYHAYYYVTFIRNGEIVENGYEGSKPKS
jgi:hypothetical protein